MVKDPLESFFNEMPFTDLASQSECLGNVATRDRNVTTDSFQQAEEQVWTAAQTGS